MHARVHYLTHIMTPVNQKSVLEMSMKFFIFFISFMHACLMFNLGELNEKS